MEDTPKTDKPISFTESILDILKRNLFRLYSVLTLFRQSEITPYYFKLTLFVYNILNYFGFNALFYTESMVEKKITDNRDNLGYPMKSEFGNIISTKVISMVFPAIVKGIVLIKLPKKEGLYTNIPSTVVHARRFTIWTDFWKKHLYRRIIAYVFMLILSLFFLFILLDFVVYILIHNIHGFILAMDVIYEFSDICTIENYYHYSYRV